MIKEATNIYPLHDLLKRRWSPRAYSDLPVEKEKIRSLFEAARWSPSAGNLQPWSFLLGFKEDETYNKIFETLDQGNKIWVSRCPVLIMAVGKTVIKNTNERHPVFKYDVGQSVAHLTFQALELGLTVHQMSGFDANAAAETFKIPEKYEALTVIAIGYIGEVDLLPEDLKKRELTARTRHDFRDFVFAGNYGEASAVFAEPSIL
jgi:nitroreductase